MVGRWSKGRTQIDIIERERRSNTPNRYTFLDCSKVTREAIEVNIIVMFNMNTAYLTKLVLLLGKLGENLHGLLTLRSLA